MLSLVGVHAAPSALPSHGSPTVPTPQHDAVVSSVTPSLVRDVCVPAPRSTIVTLRLAAVAVPPSAAPRSADAVPDRRMSFLSGFERNTRRWACEPDGLLIRFASLRAVAVKSSVGVAPALAAWPARLPAVAAPVERRNTSTFCVPGMGQSA